MRRHVNSNLTAATLCTAAILLTACGADPEPATPESSIAITTDSAGRRVVTSRAPQLPVNTWTVAPEPLVVLGDEERPLHQIVTARRLPDRRIAVLQRTPPGLLLFDRGGEIVRTLVREGDGPGEVRFPVHLHFHAPDTLWVWSAMYGPAYAVDTAGTLLAERHFDWSRLRQALGDTVFSESHHPLPTGDVVAVDVSRLNSRLADHASDIWVPVIAECQSTAMLITREYRTRNLGRRTCAGVNGVSAGVRFAPALAMSVSHVAVGTERLHFAHGGHYAVDVHAFDGTHLHQIRKDGPPARWDDSTFQRQRRDWLARYGMAFGPGEAQRAWDALPDQRSFPPISGLVSDITGGVWVRESLYRWNVFDASGAWMTSLDVPLHRIFEVGADHIIGIARDQDDVETVVELFLERTSSKF
jgi:hypothetical protein